MPLSHHGLKVLRLFVSAPSSPRCGADIMRAVQLPSGTVYPILKRFQRDKVLTSEWETERPQKLGRPRQRRYTITANGLTWARGVFADLRVRR